MPNFACPLLLVLGAGVLGAQTSPPLPLPNATTGVPYVADIGQIAISLGNFQPVYTFSSGTFNATYSFTGAAYLPPGLTISNGGIISGIPTQPGSFNDIDSYVVQIFSQNEQPAGSQQFELKLSMTVLPPTVPDGLAASPSFLVFTTAQGQTAPSAQSFQVTYNNSAGSAPPATVSASASVDQGQIVVTPNAATLSPYIPQQLTATVSTLGLPVGSYAGRIDIGNGAQQIEIPILVTVTAPEPALVFSESGLLFRGVEQGPPDGIPSQTLSLLTPVASNFTITTSTTSGGNWLSVSPSTAPASPGTLTVSVDQSILSAGIYYGQIQVAISGVSTVPPVIATVVAQILPPGQTPGLTISPAGVILFETVGDTSPKSATLTVSNPTAASQPYLINAFSQAQTEFYVPISIGPEPSAGNPSQIVIQPNVSAAPGIYNGTTDVQFVANGVTQFRTVQVILVLNPPAQAPREKQAAAQQSTCGGSSTPALQVVFTQLAGGYPVFAGWPVPLQTQVMNCGTPVNDGSVTVSFNTPDQAISLKPEGNGIWDNDWTPTNTANTSAVVTVTAKDSSTPPITGTAQVMLNLATNPGLPRTPVIGSDGIVSAASGQQNFVAPGSFISIYGTDLDSGAFSSNSLPLQTSLGVSSVAFPGLTDLELLPLSIVAVSPGYMQMNAIVPYDVPVNSTIDLSVYSSNTQSTATPVNVAFAQPGIFTLNGSGSGLAVIEDYTQGYQLVDQTHAAHAGDILVVYCAGLGAVDPPVPAGSATSGMSQTVNDVSVTVGGVSAPVSFHGLAPGFAGVYQLNVTLPASVPSGPDVPIVVTVTDQSNPLSTLSSRPDVTVNID